MTVTIRKLHQDENAQTFAEYINEIIAENAFIHLDTPVSADDEKAWLQKIFYDSQHGNAGLFIAEENGKPIGISHWEKGDQRESGNVIVGITIAQHHRGHGLGRELFNACIQDAQRHKPKNIWLKVVAGNTPAIRLYESLGFKRVAVLPKWYAYPDGVKDVDIMVLSQ